MHFVDDIMLATDVPATIVARFLKANGFEEVRMGTTSTGVGLLDRRYGDPSIKCSGVANQPSK